MSGIASAAPVMPGSAATFCNWSSERSAAICPISSRSANTRAGTRMSARASAPSSHTTPSMGRNPRTATSDIEHHRGAVTTTRGLNSQPMVGDTLDQMSWAPATEAHRRHKAAIGQVEPTRLLGHQIFGLREIHELIEPARQQRRAVTGIHCDLAPDLLVPTAAREQLSHGMQRVTEDPFLRAGLDLHFQL